MIYLAFNKPFQVLSQFKPLDDKVTLTEYIHIPEKPKAVGRLDYDSEGLLLLSDDIRFIQKMTDPEEKIEKEYIVQVEGIPKTDDLQKFAKGIRTQTENYKPAKVSLISEPEFLWERNPPIRKRQSIPTSWLSIIIREGKNRQVRKMTAFIGFPTLRLIRVRIGKISLENLKPGEFRNISKE
ncbi:MAG: pseudouridine synthase [Leptospiraceae bacterium]|nr:pseudouridine synthase [Leptospiraceae bacterium]